MRVGNLSCGHPGCSWHNTISGDCQSGLEVSSEVVTSPIGWPLHSFESVVVRKLPDAAGTGLFCAVVGPMMTLLNDYLSPALDPDEIALRSTEAAERTADWTFWLAIGTFGLLAGAVAAALFALFTWLSTKGQLAAAEAQLDMERDTKHQAEADNVSAWLVQEGAAMGVFVRNGNSTPVYDVTCLVLCKPNNEFPTPTVEMFKWFNMALPPAESGHGGDRRDVLHSAGYVYSFTDHDTKIRHNNLRGTTVILDDAEDWILWNGSPATKGLAVKIAFRDSTGIYWERDLEGKLTEVSKPS